MKAFTQDVTVTASEGLITLQTGISFFCIICSIALWLAWLQWTEGFVVSINSIFTKANQFFFQVFLALIYQLSFDLLTHPFPDIWVDMKSRKKIFCPRQRYVEFGKETKGKFGTIMNLREIVYRQLRSMHWITVVFVNVSIIQNLVCTERVAKSAWELCTELHVETLFTCADDGLLNGSLQALLFVVTWNSLFLPDLAIPVVLLWSSHWNLTSQQTSGCLPPYPQ